MECKGIFVVAFVWLSLVSRLAEGERFVFKHDDAERKTEIRGRKRAGGSEDLRPSPSAPKWANLRQLGLTADQSDIFRTAVYTANSGEYYGSKAKINLWGLPNVVNNQISASVIRLSSFDGDNENSIQAGFHMYPEEYKDSKLHFYTTWTLDGFKSTGCFNLKCVGFVLVNSGILTPGDVVEPVSAYKGSQYYITISIKKEPKSGNWSVYRDDLDKPQLIGYWPKPLFTALAEKATVVSWGGVVSYSRGGTGPSMGSGHYSSELEGKAAFVKNIEIFDSNDGSIDLANIAKSDVNRGDCYNVTALVDSGKFGLHDGYLFYFGGPGGCSN